MCVDWGSWFWMMVGKVCEIGVVVEGKVMAAEADG